jgi:hypothetical protein
MATETSGQIFSANVSNPVGSSIGSSQINFPKPTVIYSIGNSASSSHSQNSSGHRVPQPQPSMEARHAFGSFASIAEKEGLLPYHDHSRPSVLPQPIANSGVCVAGPSSGQPHEPVQRTLIYPGSMDQAHSGGFHPLEEAAQDPIGSQWPPRGSVFSFGISSTFWGCF